MADAGAPPSSDLSCAPDTLRPAAGAGADVTQRGAGLAPGSGVAAPGGTAPCPTGEGSTDPGRTGAPDAGASATLVSLQRALAQRADAEAVVLRDLVSAMEGETFPVLILMFALLLVSPLSAVPGATTLFGLTIAAIVAQWLLGRTRVWLPRVLLERRLPVGRTGAALRRLHGPVDWVERRLRRRQRWVFAAPFAQAPLALVLLAALCAPLMEVIPASGTTVGAAIVVFSAGLLARDGVVVLAGASLAAVLPVSLWLVLT